MGLPPPLGSSVAPPSPTTAPQPSLTQFSSTLPSPRCPHSSTPLRTAFLGVYPAASLPSPRESPRFSFHLPGSPPSLGSLLPERPQGSAPFSWVSLQARFPSPRCPHASAPLSLRHPSAVLPSPRGPHGSAPLPRLGRPRRRPPLPGSLQGSASLSKGLPRVRSPGRPQGRGPLPRCPHASAPLSRVSPASRLQSPVPSRGLASWSPSCGLPAEGAGGRHSRRGAARAGSGDPAGVRPGAAAARACGGAAGRVERGGSRPREPPPCHLTI